MKSHFPALVLVLAFTLTGCDWNPFHRMYSATAEIQILPEHIVDIPGVLVGGEPDFKAELLAEIQVIQSPDVLMPVIKDLKLDQVWAKRFHSDHAALSAPETLDHLDKVLKIEGLSGTNIVKVTAYSEVPQEAADIANAVVDTYKARRDLEDQLQNSRGVNELREQIGEQQKMVDVKKISLEKQREALSYPPNEITIPPHPSDPNLMVSFKAAERDFDQQLALLDALNVRLKQDIADEKLMESNVRILTRADAPPQ